jgi:hypothetical protein
MSQDHYTVRCLRALRTFAAALEHCITRIGTGFARWTL